MSTTKTAQIRTKKAVFLVDDHPLVRDWLSRLINEETDLEVTGWADNAESAISSIERLQATGRSKPCVPIPLTSDFWPRQPAVYTNINSM